MIWFAWRLRFIGRSCTNKEAEGSVPSKTDAIIERVGNPRRYETNPLLVDIENHIKELAPDMKRVSSGRSAFCDDLSDRLRSVDAVVDVLYLEGQHTEIQSPDQYLGVWESVNDVRVQMGTEKFAAFLEYIREKTKGLNSIKADYTTRAWLAKMK